MLRMNGQLQEITIVRGDSGVIKVVDHDLTKTERPFSEGTVVSLGVKRAVRDEEYLLLKQVTSFSPEGRAYIEFVPEDTSSKPIGKFLYDLEVKRPSGWVDTFINNKPFIIKNDIVK